MRKMTRCSCKACQCRRMRCCGCSWCGGCRLPLSWCSCRWSQTERSSEVVLHQKSSGWLMMSSSWIGRRTHLTFLTLAWDQWRDQSENEDDEKNKEVIMDELTESDDSSLSMVDPRREEEVLPPSPPCSKTL